MNYLNENFELEFPHISYKYEEITFGGIIPCFFINISEEDLQKDWQAITSFIALNYQSELSNEFSVWNIYIFFLLEKEIEDSLKYLIENDTFSCRKIVISPCQNIEEIINEHIKNSDLTVNKDEQFQNVEFERNDLLWDALSEIGDKKRKTKEHSLSLDKIIITLRG